MEQAELRKRQEFERRKQTEREKKKNRVAAHRKVVARQLAKQYLQGARANAFRLLTDTGFFINKFQIDVIEQDVLPWLQMTATAHLFGLEQVGFVPDELVGGFFDEAEREHQATVEAERLRREQVRLQQEQAAREREEAKQQRRAAREAARKARELQKLKDEVFAEFVAKGEPREGILVQDLVEANGNYQRAPAMGGLGGLLGQLVLCFSAVHKRWKKELAGED